MKLSVVFICFKLRQLIYGNILKTEKSLAIGRALSIATKMTGGYRLASEKRVASLLDSDGSCRSVTRVYIRLCGKGEKLTPYTLQ